MMPSKGTNKLSSTGSNKRPIRKIQTEANESVPHRRTEFSNRGSERNYSKAKHLPMQSNLHPTNYRKTFKINPYKNNPTNKYMRTEPDEPMRRITNVSSGSRNKTGQGKYKIDGVAGKGTFGTVYFGHIRGEGRRVAIKKVFLDKRYKNRELQILKVLKNPCVLEMRDHFMTYDGEQEYLNVVMDYYQANLYQVIKKKQITSASTKVIMFQILRGLNYLRTLSISHRDIKPQNILVDVNSCRTVICDFGSAKQLIEGQPNLAYICSRCYRAPELIFGATNYTTQIDMWSLGCVLVEMINGDPPFIGDSQVDQLIEIIKVLGTPKKQDVLEMNNQYDMKEYAKIPNVKPIEWKALLRTGNKKLIDLVDKLLKYSPKKRLSPAEALLHPYFDDLRSEQYYKEMKSVYKELPDLFNFTKDQLLILKEPQKLIPKWHSKQPSNPLHKISNIKVNKTLHRVI